MTLQLDPVAERDTTLPRTAARAGAWLGFVAVVCAAVMDLLDSTVAQTAGPAIQASLGGSSADLEWITAAYTLALAVGLLVGGRLGDVFGRARVLLVGMAGFAGASLLCALAPTMELLLLGRVLQGAVGAVMLPQTFGLFRDLFGAEGQRKAFAIIGPVMGLTAVLGPVIGGALVDLDLAGLGWRTIFLLNLPVAAGAIWLGLRHIPRVPPTASGARIDLASVALAGTGTFALVFPVVEGRSHDWAWWLFVLLGAGVVALVTLLRRQGGLTDRAPLVEPSLLRRRAYVGGLALVVCFIGGMGGMTLVLTVMFQTGLGFTPLGAGVATLAIPGAAILGSITSSALLERLGRTTIHVGLALMAGGLVVTDLVLRSAGAGLSAWETALPLLVAGFGMGMVFVPMFDVILAGVEPHQLGSASGLLESVQQLGMSVGIAVVGTVFFGVIGVTGGAAAFVGGAGDALLVSVALLCAGWIVTWALPRHARAD